MSDLLIFLTYVAQVLGYTGIIWAFWLLISKVA